MKTIQEVLHSPNLARTVSSLLGAKHYIPDKGELELPPNHKEIQLALVRAVISLYSIGFTLDDNQTKRNIRTALSKIPAVTSCITLPDVGIGVRPQGRRFHVPLHRLVEAYLLSRTFGDTNGKRSLTAAINHLTKNLGTESKNLGAEPRNEELERSLHNTACVVDARAPLVARSIYWTKLIINRLAGLEVDTYPQTTDPNWFVRYLPDHPSSNPPSVRYLPNPPSDENTDEDTDKRIWGVPISHSYLLHLYLMEAQAVDYISLTESYRKTTLGSLNHRINQLPARLLLSAIEHGGHSMLTPFELAINRREDM